MSDKLTTYEKRLSVLVVNYNGADFIASCLDSLRAQLTGEDEVIVVDNASSDGSDSLIEKVYPWVKLVRSNTNLGFTGGNNLAASHAKGEFLLLLNNDASIEKGINAAIARFSNHSLGVIGARIYYPNGKLQPSVGYKHTPLRLILSWLGLRRFSHILPIFSRTVEDPDFYGAPAINLAWVSGAAMLTRREIWEELGGLDERYFMYMEDADYCDSVKSAGYGIAYEPNFVVIHHEAGGKMWVGEKALLRTVDSYKIYLKKHYGTSVCHMTRLTLSMIFIARSVFASIKYYVAHRILDLEKKKAYRSASFNILKKGLQMDARANELRQNGGA